MLPSIQQSFQFINELFKLNRRLLEKTGVGGDGSFVEMPDERWNEEIQLCADFKKVRGDQVACVCFEQNYGLLSNLGQKFPLYHRIQELVGDNIATGNLEYYNYYYLIKLLFCN